MKHNCYKKSLKELKRQLCPRVKYEQMFLINFIVFFSLWIILYGFIGINISAPNLFMYSLGKISEWLIPSLAVSIFVYYLFSFRPQKHYQKNILISEWIVFSVLKTETHPDGCNYGLYFLIKDYKEFFLYFLDEYEIDNNELHNKVYNSIYQFDYTLDGIEDLLKRKINSKSQKKIIDLSNAINKQIINIKAQSEKIKTIPIYFLVSEIYLQFNKLTESLLLDSLSKNPPNYNYSLYKNKFIKLHLLYRLLYEWLIFYKVFDSQRHQTKQ